METTYFFTILNKCFVHKIRHQNIKMQTVYNSIYTKNNVFLLMIIYTWQVGSGSIKKVTDPLH